MIKTITRGLVVAAAIFAGVNSAQAQFTLDGQYRSRLEIRDGFKKPILDSQSPAAFVEQRARLNAAFKSEKVGFKLSVQDVRIWGEVGQINKSDLLLSAHEAYGDYYATENSTFRIGRQEVVYDGARFFGNLDWAMQGRSLDALRYLYKNDKTQFDVMASFNQAGYGDGAPEPAKLVGSTYSIQTGGGTPRIFNLGLPQSQLMAYYKRSFDGGSIGVMALSDMYNPAVGADYSDVTIGITPTYALGDVSVGGQFYYTAGKASATTDLGGYMFNAFIQLPKVIGSPLLGLDYITGDDETTADKVEGWSPKYGTNHAFYGFMDYFFVGNGHGGANAKSAGLLDIQLKTKFKLSDKTVLLGQAHYFASTAERTYNGESYQGGLGTELDLVVAHTLAPGLSLKAGYSQMFGITDTMKGLKYGDPTKEISGLQNWGWVMIAFSPKFL